MMLPFILPFLMEISGRWKRDDAFGKREKWLVFEKNDHFNFRKIFSIEPFFLLTPSERMCTVKLVTFSINNVTEKKTKKPDSN